MVQRMPKKLLRQIPRHNRQKVAILKNERNRQKILRNRNFQTNNPYRENQDQSLTQMICSSAHSTLQEMESTPKSEISPKQE
jgi:hypothetical protein